MQKLFFPSSGSTFRDRDGVVREIRHIAKRICAERPEIQEIVLFGSYATGTAGYFSDIDLVVIVNHDPRHPHQRIPEYLLLFREAPLPVDLFVFTRDEVAARDGAGDPFMRRLSTEGVHLAP